jgi:hypothetical protein
MLSDVAPATTTMTMRRRWREPAMMTVQEDASMMNVARGRGRRHQAIKDNETRQRDPIKYLIYKVN